MMASVSSPLIAAESAAGLSGAVSINNGVVPVSYAVRSALSSEADVVNDADDVRDVPKADTADDCHYTSRRSYRLSQSVTFDRTTRMAG
jgi:hypothetical protein